jgi:hypothetical protein
LTVRGTEKIWDTTLPGMGLLWAKAQGDSILRRYSALTFERFWKRELDVEDVTVVEAVLRESGAGVSGFREHALEGRREYLALQESIRRRHLGVPGHVSTASTTGTTRAPAADPLDPRRPQGPAPDVAYRHFA